MKKLDLTLVCCYNNTKQLNEELIDSLNNQNVICEKIFIDNTNNRFSSASSALNYGASLVKTKYVIFLHQDICFMENDSLKKIYDYLVEYDGSIVGVAGVKYEKDGVYTSIVHGKNKKNAGNIRINKPVNTIAIDECLFGMNIELFNKIKFDEKNFDNWHLYAVDFCYNASLNNIKVYTVPACIWHTSTGNFNHKFFIGVKRLRKKYKKYFNMIKTTCISVGKNEILFFKEFRLFILPNNKIYKSIKRMVKKDE